MLLSIECSELNDKKIIFHNGLNVIMGDSNATNSIGKTTALKLIDLSFGAKNISAYQELIDQYGKELCIKFTHCIENKELVFSRTFADFDVVNCFSLDSGVTETIKLAEFNKLMKKSYNIRDADISFRQSVNQTTRIWSTNQITTALGEHANKKVDAVNTLLKLCNEYHPLKEIDVISAEKKKHLDAKKIVAKNESIPTKKKD